MSTNPRKDIEVATDGKNVNVSQGSDILHIDTPSPAAALALAKAIAVAIVAYAND